MGYNPDPPPREIGTFNTQNSKHCGPFLCNLIPLIAIIMAIVVMVSDLCLNSMLKQCCLIKKRNIYTPPSLPLQTTKAKFLILPKFVIFTGSRARSWWSSGNGYSNMILVWVVYYRAKSYSCSYTFLCIYFVERCACPLYTLNIFFTKIIAFSFYQTPSLTIHMHSTWWISIVRCYDLHCILHCYHMLWKCKRGWSLPSKVKLNYISRTRHSLELYKTTLFVAYYKESTGATLRYHLLRTKYLL